MLMSTLKCECKKYIKMVIYYAYYLYKHLTQPKEKKSEKIT